MPALHARALALALTKAHTIMCSRNRFLVLPTQRLVAERLGRRAMRLPTPGVPRSVPTARPHARPVPEGSSM